ncbi:MAG: hypothetical protein JXA00_01005, partial [Candidatus Thermoplasmatota archaeon]|nr:hypothetical protein [Candidatus Thermoplasmatota archaeon]
MPVKDRIVTWFIKNIVVPRREIIDQPGFIVTTFTDQSSETYLREILIPEKLFQCIENRIIQRYNEQGKQTLYSAGKKFGYLYASMSNFPNIDNNNGKKIVDFAYQLVRYNECMYAQSAEHEIDIEKKMFSISFNDYVVCRHNGFGYIMADGGIAGIWAYLMQDKSIDGIQTLCQGRGDQQCKVLCAPKQLLNENYPTYFKEENLPSFKFDTNYKKMNEIRPTKYPAKSFKQLLNAGFFRYGHGILTYKGSRFFLSESHILYLLESELSKLIDGEQVLFEACFEFGQFLHQLYG